MPPRNSESDGSSVTECRAAPQNLAKDTSRVKPRSKRPCRNWSDNSSLQKKSKKESICLMTRLEKESDIGVRVRFEPSLLSDLDDELIWQNSTIDHTCGFVVSSSHGDLTDGDLAQSITHKLLGGERKDVDSEAMRRPVYDLLCTGTDTLDQVIDSVAKFHKNKGRTRILFGERDLPRWNANRDRPQYQRGLAFFYRLTKPLCIKFFAGKRLVARGSKVSILDAMLDIPEIQEFVVDAILLRLCCHCTISEGSFVDDSFVGKMILVLSSSVDWGQANLVNAYRDVSRFVCKIRPELADRLSGFCPPITVASPAKEKAKLLYMHKTTIWKEYTTWIDERDKVLQRLPNVTASSKSGDSETRESRRKFLEQRQYLIESHRGQSDLAITGELSVGKSTGAVLPMKNDVDRSLLFTDRDMSHADFISNVHFMNEVNESLPRFFISGVSRPRLQKVELPTDKINEIKRLFFDADGSLRDDVKNDIDLSSKHGFINFQNLVNFETRDDKRWQVPIRQHSLGCLTPTRKAVERILAAAFDPETETLDDLGILIGGTEDQPLHHDLARQHVSWLPEKWLYSGVSGMTPASGWEVDRLAYNEAMSSPNAPASLVMGMGDNTEVLLGVQNDQIIRVGGKLCCIKGGVDDECFEIVRENESLVVIRATTAVMFTGDFPHAGVRNVKVGSSQERLLGSLNKRIAFVLGHCVDNYSLAQTKGVVDVLCGFPNLDSLCRLHFATVMSTTKLPVPVNTVGFNDCLANPRDTRCLDGDAPVHHQPNSSSQWDSRALVDANAEETEDESGDDDEWDEEDTIQSIHGHKKRKYPRH